MLSHQQNTINNMSLIVLDSVIESCIVSTLISPFKKKKCVHGAHRTDGHVSTRCYASVQLLSTLPPFQIVSHSKNLGKSKHFHV